MAEQVSLSPAFQSIHDFLEKLTTKVSWLSYVAMAILPVLITVDVCCRLFGFSVPGSLELQENLLALTTFSFMAVLQLHDRHMMIDFIYDRTLGQDAQATAGYVTSVVEAMGDCGIGRRRTGSAGCGRGTG